MPLLLLLLLGARRPCVTQPQVFLAELKGASGTDDVVLAGVSQEAALGKVVGWRSLTHMSHILLVVRMRTVEQPPHAQAAPLDACKPTLQVVFASDPGAVRMWVCVAVFMCMCVRTRFPCA
jgi:hypothetical protein